MDEVVANPDLKENVLVLQALWVASTGAGAILKRLRSSKIVSKGRSRSDSSPGDVICGKHSNSSSIYVDHILIKVLDRIAYVMRELVDIVKRILELGTRGVEAGEEELRRRTTINHRVIGLIFLLFT
ncbi:hypothetical protein Tco_0764030 [Tanacetum coccineum]